MKQSMIRAVLVGVTAAAGVLAIAAPASAAPVVGAGTLQSPYTADCDDDTPHDAVTCTVSFPLRTVQPLGSAKLDYYRCPLDHAYLENKNYALGRADISPGIEIRGVTPVGIDAVNVYAIYNPVHDVTAPTGNNSGGTVTNSTTGPRDYGVTLHCTNDIDKSYPRHLPLSSGSLDSLSAL